MCCMPEYCYQSIRYSEPLFTLNLRCSVCVCVCVCVCVFNLKQKTSLISNLFIRVKSYLPAWDNLGRNNLRGHLHKTMKLANKLNISLDNLDKIPLTFQPRNSLKLELTDFGTLPPPSASSLLIYTDGSKTMEGTGAGFAVYQTDTTHKTFQLIHSNHYKFF